MINPFLNDGYLTTNASINKVIIAKTPENKKFEIYKGKSAMDIFCTKIFIEEIKKNSSKLKLDLINIEEKYLPQYLGRCLESSDNDVKETAESIVKLFGERLGLIFLTLKQGVKENRILRKDWDDIHWNYFNQLDNLILTGGLASGNIGERFKYYIEKVFKDEKEKCYNIILNKDSSNLGIKGCVSYINNKNRNEIFLVLDCGQSFIKRSLVKINNGQVKEVKNLEKRISKHVQWNFNNEEEEKNEAVKLHNYLMDIIFQSIKESDGRISDEIVISIANYVKAGSFVNRGGYGKLRLLDCNYEEYLSNEIYKIVNKRFKITFIHDGTAMAHGFKEYKNSVCISLGTAFGIGFC